MIHFVIGTRAQLFKMAPIMLECKKRKLKWRWVYAAQHRETISETLQTFNLPSPDYTIVRWDTEAKTMGKVWKWFLVMIWELRRSKKILSGFTGKNHIVLTHGDTLTTWLGALMGRLTRTNVMHVESGLRSFNIFRPFPEEINRLITFRLSNYYACPGRWALKNLHKYKGIKINTLENTQVDTLTYGLKNYKKAKIELPKDQYVVVSIHRYENIFKQDRFAEIINQIERIAKKFTIIFVQHPATKIQIDKLGYRDRLENNKGIIMSPRLEYLPWIKAIVNSEFVIADGGGNQEELYHMGKPTLLFRNETERQEGLGKTAVVSGVNSKKIDYFVRNYKRYINHRTKQKNSPSKIIVDSLSQFNT